MWHDDVLQELRVDGRTSRVKERVLPARGMDRRMDALGMDALGMDGEVGALLMQGWDPLRSRATDGVACYSCKVEMCT